LAARRARRLIGAAPAPPYHLRGARPVLARCARSAPPMPPGPPSPRAERAAPLVADSRAARARGVPGAAKPHPADLPVLVLLAVLLLAGAARADVAPGGRITQANVEQGKELISPGVEWGIPPGFPLTGGESRPICGAR